MYLPRWRSGPPAALDFAVTSGLNQDVMAECIRDREVACRRYEDRKKSYKDTATHCQHQGLTFIPMVVEAVGGGWGQSARTVWSEIAKLSASAMGDLATDSECGVSGMRRLSIVLHRENARAVMRRFCHAGLQPSPVQLSIQATLAEDNVPAL